MIEIIIHSAKRSRRWTDRITIQSRSSGSFARRRYIFPYEAPGSGQGGGQSDTAGGIGERSAARERRAAQTQEPGSDSAQTARFVRGNTALHECTQLLSKIKVLILGRKIGPWNEVQL